jgi:uncharacterized protein
MMSALPGYIYATDSDSSVYVNLFIGSKAKLSLASGTVEVTQTTRYPWDGDVRITIEPSQVSTFDLLVRVPGWCRGGSSDGGLYTTTANRADSFSVTVNGSSLPNLETTDGYACLHREWRSGDLVQIHMAMPVKRVQADERVEADRGRIALMSGPLVYCLESIDNGGSVDDLVLPESAAITEKHRADLLGEVTVLQAPGQRTGSGGVPTVPAEITAIPYYANANRGPVSMTVWIANTAQ